MTQQQFNIHVEDVREKLLSEATKLNLSPKQIFDEFVKSSNMKINRKIFKQKLMNLGFNLVDFPDEDFLAIDVDNSGEIDVKEFKDFFNLALDNDSLPSPPPPPPEDDLQFQPTDLDGRITIACIEAKGLRPSSAWFDCFKDKNTQMRSNTLVFEPVPRQQRLLNPLASTEDLEEGGGTDELLHKDDSKTSSTDKGNLGIIAHARKFAKTAKKNTSEAVDVSSKLHYTAAIKELEFRRNAFLRSLKTKPRKCSSDTQPKCWDRLPKGVKIEETYFSKKPAYRKPLTLIKQKHANMRGDKAARSECSKHSTEKEAGRNWITSTLAPEIFERLIESVLTIRDFTLSVEKSSERLVSYGNSSARDKKLNGREEEDGLSVEAVNRREISQGTIVYQRYAPVKSLDMDTISGQKACKSSVIDIASAWFRHIDKDESGMISFREFRDCISELDLMVSKADTQLLMQRFKIENEESGEMSLIRYREFLLWAEGAVAGKLTREETHQKSIPHVSSLIKMVKDASEKFSDQKITTLKSDQASLHVFQDALRDMDCRMSINSVYRLSRCFDGDLVAFNDYLNGADGQLPNDDALDLAQLKRQLQSVLKRRCEDGKNGQGETLINSSKIWAQLTSTKSGTVEFSKVRDKVRISAALHNVVNVNNAE